MSAATFLPTRRQVALAVLGAGSASFAAGCGRSTASLVCTDDSALPPDDRAARGRVAYVDRSMEADRTCEACQQWIAPPSSSACGGCKVLKGPVHPLGSCKVFVRQS